MTHETPPVEDEPLWELRFWIDPQRVFRHAAHQRVGREVPLVNLEPYMLEALVRRIHELALESLEEYRTLQEEFHA